MKWLKKAWYLPAVIFLLLSIIDVCCLAFCPDGQGIHSVIKPFLMPCLAITALFMFLAKSVPVPIMLFLLLALICDTAGDIFLIRPDQDFFIRGLLAFFVGHIFYLIILRSNLKEYNMNEKPFSFIRTIIYLFFCVFIPYLIAHYAVKFSPESSSLFGYIFIYAWVLITVAYMAARCWILHVPTAYLVFIGAILFIISDSMLALKAFAHVSFAPNYYDASVMLSYLLAQALIVYGISNFYREAKKDYNEQLDDLYQDCLEEIEGETND